MGFHGIDARTHIDELVTDHLIADQRAAKGFAFTRVVQRFFVADIRECAGLRREHQALLIEIQHDRHEALILRTDAIGDRSEEHTSELQSLMRISYAVFCLKKKKKHEQKK